MIVFLPEQFVRRSALLGHVHASHSTRMANSRFFDLQQLTNSNARFAPVILRIALGVVFMAHAYAKITVFTIPGTVSFFQQFGFPGWTVYPVIGIELLGGASLLLGYHTRAVALALVPVMLGALVPHLGNGWMFTNTGGGWEYVAFLLAALGSQILLGGGAYALTRDEAKAGGSTREPLVRDAALSAPAR
jgi:putative oxidoreductase